MATIKAGTYRFNDVLSAPSVDVYQDINFTFNATPVGSQPFVFTCDNMHFLLAGKVVTGSTRVVALDVELDVELPNGFSWYYDGWDADGLFADDGYKTITIQADSEVSDNFNVWFKENTNPVTATIKYNGKTIASLLSGQTATIKCKGDNVKMLSDIEVRAEGGGGGSGSVVVWFVSFMGADGSLLFKMPVLDGDDCKNPVTHGDITTPTKESTVQYDYTYSGWSLTEGGTADTTNALANVTEDRTVYAAFTETVRKYTITYYDSDGTTVLKTEQVAYGEVPSYVPEEKDDYIFDTWNPKASAVNGDTSYTAVWKLKPAFATAAWSEIKEIADSGNAESTFSLGDTRDEIITYEDGTTETVTFEIVGFAEEKIYNTGKPNIILLATHVLEEPVQFGTTFSYLYYSNSVLQNHIKSLHDGLSEEMKGVVRTSQLYYCEYDNTGLMAPSSYTILGAEMKDGYGESVDTLYSNYQIDVFKNGKSKTCSKRDGTVVPYWVCNVSKYDSSKNYPSYINTSGALKRSSSLSDRHYVRLMCFV